MKTIIHIRDFLPSVIGTRKSIAILTDEMDKIKTEDSIILDFSNIILISRSFANEIIHIANSKQYNIELANINENISLIIRSVENTLSGKNKVYDNIPVTSFNNNKELFDFLATV